MSLLLLLYDLGVLYEADSKPANSLVSYQFFGLVWFGLVFWVLGIEPKTSCNLSSGSATEPHCPAP
jgi:hypothetical protein